jgi:hypothetical protein
MIRFLLLLLSYIIITNGRHFDGGTITWQPIDPNINSSIVPITISQYYLWTASIMTCATDVPISTPAKAAENKNLTCVANCATNGGYSANPIDILTDCQTVSSSTNVMTSQRSVNINLTAGAYFSVQYAWQYWIALNYPRQSNPTWSLVCSIDLRLRPDGFINTAPVASVISPQYAIVNQTTEITIPVWDVNAGDDVRCRWAVDTSGSNPVVSISFETQETIKATSSYSYLQGVDECAGICYPSSVPNGTTLSNCTISFFGPITGVWYGVALQV